MEYCIVVPARFGQQQINDKNLREIHGRSLVERSLTHASYLSGSKVRVCLSTNEPGKITRAIKSLTLDQSEKIFKLEKESIETFNGVDIHNRPERFATPFSSTRETLQNLRECYLKMGISFSRWLIFQPTSPFRDCTELDEMMNFVMLEKNKDSYSLVSVTNVGDKHPARMYKKVDHGLERYLPNAKSEFSRRQDLEDLYVRDGGFYVTSDSLLADGQFISSNPSFIVRSYPWHINIDTEEDIRFAQSVSSEVIFGDPNSK